MSHVNGMRDESLLGCATNACSCLRPARTSRTPSERSSAEVSTRPQCTALRVTCDRYWLAVSGVTPTSSHKYTKKRSKSAGDGVTSSPEPSPTRLRNDSQ